MGKGTKAANKTSITQSQLKSSRGIGQDSLLESLLGKTVTIDGLERRLVIKEDWDESEAGWGVRPDGYSLHRNRTDLKSYVAAYWKRMPKAVPHEYSRPSESPEVVGVDEKTYKQVVKSEYGIRCWGRFPAKK